MNKEDLTIAFENAWSFSGLVPPIGSIFLGIKKTEHDEYSLYKDDTGNYYYQSKRSLQFERELIEKRKQNNKNSLSVRNKNHINISY